LQYHDRVDNRGSDSDKEASYRSFADKSQRAFDAEDTRRYQYLEQVGVNSDRRNFEKALQKGGIDPALSPTILIPHRNPFAQRTGHLLQWLAYSFGIGAAVWLFLLLWPSVNAEKLKALKEPTPGGEQHEPNGLALLLPRHQFYGLPILLDVNIGVFLAMAFAGLGVVSFQTDDLLAWGANYGPDIHGLGVFRLVTSQFVHGGIMHLLSNMYGLLFAGMFLAPVARNSRLIACYLLCGLGGSIASFVVHPAIMSVGASGAIMGLWGILLPLILLRDPRISAVAAPILINAAVFVGLTLLIGAVGQGIDNAAHVGGLATGIVIGFALFFLDRGKEPDVILARSEND
jgi:rhomboid protease GluP